MNFILIAVLVLGAIALIAALVLFGVSKKFAVEEDPRLGQVGELLPGANCGGCGFAGCSGMAAALVKGADAGSIDGLMCPVGGADVMGKVADLLGLAVANTEAEVPVVRCNGSCEHRPRIAEYDGLHTCAAMNSCGAGETGCGFGCLGCGACAKACPRHIIELRKKGPKGRRVYVQCVNHDKGAVAKKACSVACIGCGKCQKVCKFDAITIENNVAYVDFNKCRMCTKCVDECPTGALVKVNFPVKKAKPAAEAAPVAEAPVAAPKAEAPVATPKLETSEEKKED